MYFMAFLASQPDTINLKRCSILSTVRSIVAAGICNVTGPTILEGSVSVEGKQGKNNYVCVRSGQPTCVRIGAVQFL